MHMFFNLIERSKQYTDDDGIDVENLAEARRLAVAAAREIIAAQILEGFIDTFGHIDIVDCDGNVLAEIPLAGTIVSIES